MDLADDDAGHMTMLITMITMMMTTMTTLMIGKPMPEDGQLSAAWTAGEPEVIARCNNQCAIVQPLCIGQVSNIGTNVPTEEPAHQPVSAASEMCQRVLCVVGAMCGMLRPPCRHSCLTHCY